MFWVPVIQKSIFYQRFSQFMKCFIFRAQGNAQLSGAARSAILRPKDTLGLSGTMNLSRSTEDLKPHPPNSTLGKIL